MKKIIILIILIALGAFIYSKSDSAKIVPRDGAMENDEAVEIDDEMEEELNEEDTDEGVGTTVSFMNPSYRVSSSQSTIQWKGTMGDIKSHIGTFSIKDEAQVFAEEGGTLSGDIVIDMTSVTSDGGERLNTHLASPDFFDVEKYPEATLSITEYDLVTGLVTADLTMKDITDSVVFLVRFTENETEIIGTGELEIDRSLWDIRYGSGSFFDDLGDTLIEDEVTIEFTIVLEK